MRWAGNAMVMAVLLVIILCLWWDEDLDEYRGEE